jgi:hypothetical protein
MIKDAAGSWQLVFPIATVMNVLVVALALFVLRPLRARTMAKS